jgi:hypothetical protein
VTVDCLVHLEPNTSASDLSWSKGKVCLSGKEDCVRVEIMLRGLVLWRAIVQFGRQLQTLADLMRSVGYEGLAHVIFSSNWNWIQTPSHCILIGHSTIASQSVLLPSSILPPPSSYCAFPKCYFISIFTILKLHKSEIYKSGSVCNRGSTFAKQHKGTE